MHKQKKINLIFIGAALSTVGLTGCSPHVDDVPQNMTRSFYENKESCMKDWQEKECESRGSGSSATSGGHWGPYYSNAGTVYRYDGTTRSLTQQPQHAVTNLSSQLSTNQVYSNVDGAYAKTAPAPGATQAKSSAFSRSTASVQSARSSGGGFGSGVRSSFGG